MPYKDPAKNNACKRKWYLDNRELVNERARDRHKANPERHRSSEKKYRASFSSDEKRDRSYQRRYGISLKEYNEILEAQGNRCPICSKPYKLGDRPFHVDHDHKTDKVRGILCHGCNIGLGFIIDSGLLDKALEYLEKPKSIGP